MGLQPADMLDREVSDTLRLLPPACRQYSKARLAFSGCTAATCSDMLIQSQAVDEPVDTAAP